jgi:hypothetical protein
VISWFLGIICRPCSVKSSTFSSRYLLLTEAK